MDNPKLDNQAKTHSSSSSSALSPSELTVCPGEDMRECGAPSPRAEGSTDELIEAVGIYMVKCYLPSRFEHLRDKIAEVLKPEYSGRNFSGEPPAGTAQPPSGEKP